MTILYIDDDADDRAFFMEAFKQIDRDLVCQTASNGKQAIEMLTISTQLPDYIFLDINMPVMDGKQCLEMLKTNQKLNHILVVIYSTTSDPMEIKKLHNLDILFFLRKPNSFSHLYTALTTFYTAIKEHRKSHS